jgi:phosphoglycolate phosphatase-like HAD superfamily hydrolase
MTVEYGIIFDCDGVLADTEKFGHLPAFNLAFTQLELPVQWTVEEYAILLEIGGEKKDLKVYLPKMVIWLNRLGMNLKIQEII